MALADIYKQNAADTTLANNKTGTQHIIIPEYSTVAKSSHTTAGKIKNKRIGIPNTTNMVNNKPIEKDCEQIQSETKQSVDTEILEDDNDGFIVHNNRRRRRQFIIGNKNKQDDDEFLASEKKIWIYVGRVENGTSAEKLENFLKKHYPAHQFQCEILNNKKENRNWSFKVGAPEELKDQLYDANNWPKNIMIKRFLFRRQTATF